MTHFVTVVIGGDVEGQLARYDENTEVAPYKRRIDGDHLQRFKEWVMSEHDVAADAPDATLVSYVEEWEGRPGHLDEAGLYCMTTYNPDSKWDWWVVGGRWAGALPRKDGIPADTALAGEVDWDAFFAKSAPWVVVAEGVWQEVGRIGWFGSVDKTNEAEWNARVQTILRGLGPEVPITIVDCHI